ncbi:GNAT family N-acetyltransferase [Cutibacterium sp. WCA-380-WT-3A]|uniref:GNAT family N-acetyltransferase n=1 Tax=Cutibacterium porci TaxID=2605781 RepID=A0A7K0J9D3_9ACTN|nr:GNAT family N-acetyltransferase [Cutibacterium porci]MSS46587.1 GNAT family N-acetyltransferase [Cutibacterium porci]
MAESTSSVQVPDPYRLELVTSDGSRSEAVDNVLQAVALGFHLAQPSDAELERYAAYVAGQQLWTIRQPDPDPEFPGLPVATMATYSSTINTGHGHLEPATFITDVTVRASHRRRGLLRTLMTNALTRSKDEGLAFAALTATEGSIYGRFGYGISTRSQSVEIVADGRFKLNHTPQGTVSMADPLAIDDLRLAVFSEFHRAHRGSHNREPWHVDFSSGRWNPQMGGPNRRIRSIVHYNDDGEPDGVVSYEIDKDFGSRITVRDMVATTADAEVALWEFLASIDLIETITAPKVDPATALPWAVEDPRVVKFTRHTDLGWLRILDVDKAMAVRGWDHQGSVTFHVVDPMGYAEGTWRVDVEAPGAPAAVTKVDDSTDAATLDVAALGSLYFGMGRGFSLAAAHRVTGTDEQIAAVDRMFSTVDVAHNISEF